MTHEQCLQGAVYEFTPRQMIQNHTHISNSYELLDRLCSMPKTEIHVHIEGATEAKTYYQIAKRNHVNLPTQSLGEWQSFSFGSFHHKVIIAWAVSNGEKPIPFVKWLMLVFTAQSTQMI